MRVRDLNHDKLKTALLTDGWTITHDPMRLRWGNMALYVELAAERPSLPGRADQRIAVLLQSFAGHNDLEELQVALGRYTLVHRALDKDEPERGVYLAVPETAWYGLLAEPIVRLTLKDRQIRLLIFSPQDAVIREWVPQADYAVA